MTLRQIVYYRYSDCRLTRHVLRRRSVHFAVVLLTTVLVAYHANLVLHGRTTFESNRRVDAYNLGWKQNVLEVLGARWKIAIFWPFVASRKSLKDLKRIRLGH